MSNKVYNVWVHVEEYDPVSGTSRDVELPWKIERLDNETKAVAYARQVVHYADTHAPDIYDAMRDHAAQSVRLSESTIVGQMVRVDHPDDSRGTCPKCGDTVYADGSGGVCMSGCYLSSDDLRQATARP